MVTLLLARTGPKLLHRFSRTRWLSDMGPLKGNTRLAADGSELQFTSVQSLDQRFGLGNNILGNCRIVFAQRAGVRADREFVDLPFRVTAPCHFQEINEGDPEIHYC